ncbi:MAG: glycosyltransferase family 4 protein [Magnetococcales bacterium]|nr:glycosyltransferase family 4 protein [Magnetococcales bacterium]
MARKILYLVTEDWYFCSHRLPIARAMRDAGWQVVVATHVTDHGAIIEREGFRLVPIRMRRRAPSLWHEWQSLWELVQLYRREQPDIVHHVALRPVFFGTLAARIARLSRVVNALTGLGYLFTSADRRARWLRYLIQPLLRWLLRHRSVTVVVQNSDDFHAVTSLAGLAGDRLALIAGSGVDTDHFAVQPQPVCHDRVVIATMVSRMLRDKGVIELVQAARLLLQWSTPVRIRLVGSPDPDNPSSLTAEQLQLWHDEGVVEWLGERRDIVQVWAASHIALLPSHREGMPKSLLEAAACGRPLITTNVPGCRHLVTNGVDGLLVEVNQPEQLARAIDRLVRDADLRQRLGAAARKRVEQDHAQHVVVRATMNLYWKDKGPS